MERVSILMLVWNALPYVKLALESIQKSTNPNLYKLIIWDNGSNQETRNYLTHYSRTNSNTRVISSKKNIGVWKARYSLAKESRTELICSVDSDTYFPEGWLTSLIKSYDSSENVGQVGPLKISNKYLHHYKNIPIKKYWHEIESIHKDPVDQLNVFLDNYSFNEFTRDMIVKNKNMDRKLSIPTDSISTCTMLMDRNLFLDMKINDSRYRKIN